MNPGLLFSWLPLAGIIIGLMRVRFRRLPWIAAGLFVVAYLLYFAAYGIYAAQCADCVGGLGETRGDMLLIAGLFFGLMLVLTLAGIALGARLTVLLVRLFHTVGELRKSGEQQGRPPVT
jgi:hypothetical protein